jgi:hypothetical protein
LPKPTAKPTDAIMKANRLDHTAFPVAVIKISYLLLPRQQLSPRPIYVSRVASETL